VPIQFVPIQIVPIQFVPIQFVHVYKKMTRTTSDDRKMHF
jgi:hypothetical protein